MSDSRIEKLKHKGFVWNIGFNTEDIHMTGVTTKDRFEVSCDGPLRARPGYYKTIDEARKACREATEAFLCSVPQTADEWVDAIEDCVVWDGYEDMHIDKKAVMIVLEKYKKHGEKL